MSTLDIERFQSSVVARAAELIEVTKSGRKDRAGRETCLFVMSELRHVSDVLAMEALRVADMSLSDLAAVLPEAYQSNIANGFEKRTLEEASRSAFLVALSNRGLAAAKPVMQEHTGHVSLADIVNVLQKGYSRVARRHAAGDVYGRISLWADMFIENPTMENFKGLIAQGAYLDSSLERVHAELYEKNPDRKTSFHDISRSVFEMQAIGTEIAKDEIRFASMVEQFKNDIEEDKVHIYVNDGVNRFA